MSEPEKPDAWRRVPARDLSEADEERLRAWLESVKDAKVGEAVPAPPIDLFVSESAYEMRLGGYGSMRLVPPPAGARLELLAQPPSLWERIRCWLRRLWRRIP